jgi:hypothetical protein
MFRSGLRAAVSAFVLLLGIPAFLSADENAPLLRYGLKNGKQYAFEIKIEAELEDEDEIREGVVTYSVASVQDSQFVVHPSGNLAAHVKPHPNASPRGIPMMGPPRFHGPRFGFPAGPQGITFNRQDEMLVASQELTPLPFLLGDMELPSRIATCGCRWKLATFWPKSAAPRATKPCANFSTISSHQGCDSQKVCMMGLVGRRFFGTLEEGGSDPAVWAGNASC